MENVGIINDLPIYSIEFFTKENTNSNKTNPNDKDPGNVESEKVKQNIPKPENVEPKKVEPDIPKPNNVEPKKVEPNIPKPENVEPNLPKPNIPEAPTIQTEVKIRPIKPPPVVTKIYQDVSNDIGASYRAPTPMNEYEARINIPAHERGHIIRAVAKALVMKRKINYAYFTLRWFIEPRTHHMILGGGVARVSIDGPIVDLKV